MSKVTVPFVFAESKAGFMLNKLPSYLLPWSVSWGDGRIAGKALQMEQGNVKEPIANTNKIDLTLFPRSDPFSSKVFMPIRIRRCDNKYQEAQVAEFDNTIAVVFALSTAGYTGRKPVIRILCGSI